MKKQIIAIISVILVVAMCTMLLVACAPASSPEKAQSSLEDEGYTTVRTTGYISNVVAAVTGGESQVVGSVTGTKVVEDKDGNKKTEFVCVIYYKSAKAANEAWDDAKDDAESDKKKNSDDNDWVVGKSGKMIYWGTKAGIKAAR